MPPVAPREQDRVLEFRAPVEDVVHIPDVTIERRAYVTQERVPVDPDVFEPQTRTGQRSLLRPVNVAPCRSMIAEVSEAIDSKASALDARPPTIE